MSSENGHNGATALEDTLRLHGVFRRGLQTLRITPLQAGVMLHLHRRGGAGVSTEAASGVAEVAQALGVNTSTLTPVVQDLVRKGLLKTHQHSTDKRRKPLFLTQQGQRLAQRVAERVIEALTGLEVKKDG